MCFGRALEMEGEFQVGEKCIATEEPEVMAIEMAKTDRCRDLSGNSRRYHPTSGEYQSSQEVEPKPLL